MASRMTCEASFSSPRWKYNVFLSFCGKDTRKNFTDHLFTALVRDGVHAFRDNEELERGEDISSELMDAIEGSRIAIVVFSENYASSTWCLNELVKILDCKKYGQRVLSIFHKVDPSDVRHQKNNFAEAFVRHEESFKEEMGKVNRWKAALTEAANLSGWDQLHVANGHEAELIKEVVEEVLTIMNQTQLYVAAYPIGLDSHIDRIGCLLNDGLEDVRIIGIYGSGGIGKTTIAKAVFNVMFQKFEGNSFLTNVREVSRQQNGLALLQEQLLRDILKKEKIDIRNEDRGIIIIKERLCCKRVLIVLDNVDKMVQIDKLVGEHGWFGSGSRIIITTRDEHLLNRPEVDKKYKVKTMNRNESLQLFSWHAFRQNHPLEGYMELSNDVVHYAGGLPLALVILGSLLLDRRSQDEWKSELEKLRKIPNDQILDILEISYDALDDFNKKIFLDVSCFFIGWNKDHAIAILDACGLCPKAGIRLLIERSLVTIDKYNRLDMHDLIQHMGKEIVRKQSPQKPGERSRLWLHEDALDVLTNHTGTSAVEGLKVDLCIYSYRYMGVEKFQLTTKAFSKMPNLRLLQILCPSSRSSIEWEHEDQIFFFKNLVWVEWMGFPFVYIPSNFHLGNLVILDMQWSQLEEVWWETKFLPKLKVLNLSHSDYLSCTPDFSGLPNLEKLILYDCERLVVVHESIGCLSKLVKLVLGGCEKLWNLPSGIGKLVSLEELDISSCSNLGKLPEEIGNLTHLTELDASGTVIQELPSSLGLLKNLTSFSYSAPIGPHSASIGASVAEILRKFSTSSFASHIQSRSSPLRERRTDSKSMSLLSASLYGFSSLKYLYLGYCNLADDDIPDDLWKLCRLKSLDLRDNNFCSLPSSISQLSELETLILVCCTSLQSLPMLPSSLHSLDASYCKLLEMLPNLSNLKHLRNLELLWCSKLNEIEGLEGLESVERIDLRGCDNLESLVKNGIFQVISKEFGNRNISEIFLPGNEIPEWFDIQNESPTASCQVTQLHNMEIQGLIICIVCLAIERPRGIEIPRGNLVLVVDNESKHFTWNCEGGFLDNDQDRTWVIKIPHYVWKSIADPGDVIKFSVVAHKWGDDQSIDEERSPVMKFGLRFFYTSDDKLSLENSQASPRV